MTTTVVGVFTSDAAAQSAVNQLRDVGVPMSNISVIARPTGDIVNEAGEVITLSDDHMTAGEGATVGAVWGGLVGLAALAIPGIGPLVTSNIFAAALTGVVAGAATGGIAGALIDAASVPEEHAHVYEERVRQGSTLVTAQVDDSLATQARAILHESGAENFNWDDPSIYDSSRATSQSATPAAAAAGAVMGYDAATSRPDLDRERGEFRNDEFVRSQTGYSNTGDTDPAMNEHLRKAMTDDQGDDTFRTADQAYDDSSKVGTVGGAAAGAVTGAAIGAVGGPVGSAIGATAGAITGAAAGAIGDTIGQEAETETGAFSPDNKAQYDRAADKVEDKARGVGDRIEGAARTTGNTIENAARDTGNAVERGLDADIDNDGDVGRRH